VAIRRLAVLRCDSCELESAIAHYPPPDGGGKPREQSASRLPKVIEAWEEPRHEEFAPRTAWSLFNAFTEVQKSAPPRAQMEGTLRLSSLFRKELQLT
jgi:hypothetical protein